MGKTKFEKKFGGLDLLSFIDQPLTLMAAGVQWLIGDVPNVSMRKRFFSSPSGVRVHPQFMQTSQVLKVTFSVPEGGQINDAVPIGLQLCCRAAGSDSHLLPQPETLAMTNRRELLLVRKP